MKKGILVLISICLLFGNIELLAKASQKTDFETAYFEEQDKSGEYEWLSEGIEREGNRDMLMTRGTMDELCKAGMKQYCPEYRDKLNSHLTKKDIKCLGSLAIGTAALTLAPGITWAAVISAYGPSVLECFF